MDNYVEGVDQPAHYGGKDYPYQPWHVIEAWGLNFFTGTAVKYIGRAGKKPGESYTKDLQKAIRFLHRELEIVEERERRAQLNGVNFEEGGRFIHAVLPIEQRRQEQRQRMHYVESKMDVEVISESEPQEH